jgi:hypothetical protein
MRQHGALSLPQILAFGLTARGVRYRVEVGLLHRLYLGVYAYGRADLPIRGHWMAAVLACGERALLSHRSAAALHGSLSTPGGPIDVTIPRDSGISIPGIRVHRSSQLGDVDRTEVDRIPCTTPGRTLIDLAAVVPPNVLESAVNQAERLGRVDFGGLEDLLARHRGRRGVRRLRRVLERGASGEGVPRNVLERRFLALCKRAGFSRPSVNEWLAIPGEEMQCDFVWHAERVVVEVDGFGSHRTHRAFQEDRRRDRLLRLAGWDVSRFTWDDVTHNPFHVQEVVGTMLATSRHR